MIEFSKLLFSTIDFLKEPRRGELLNELGRRLQHKAAQWLKDLPISILALGISVFPDFLKL